MEHYTYEVGVNNRIKLQSRQLGIPTYTELVHIFQFYLI